jgi:hypothetical protein
MRSPPPVPYRGLIVGRNTERTAAMATTMNDLEVLNRRFSTPAHDNTALRERLGGQVIGQRSIEAELRAAMAERTGELVVDLRTDA